MGGANLLTFVVYKIDIFILSITLYTTNLLKILLFKKINKNTNSSAKAKGLEMVRLPRQDDYRTFCMSDETEKVYRKLEEAIGVCWELKNNKKGRSLN